jgi:hypothetical protein
LLVLTFFLRGRMLEVTRRSAHELVRAAATSPPRTESLDRTPCPRCNETTLVTPSGPAQLETSDASRKLTAVLLCTHCGHVEATVENPQSLGKQAGFKAVSTAGDPDEPLRDAPEHEG